MAEYVGINIDGLAISGIWAEDSLIPEGETLVELTGEATLGWTYVDGSWIAPLVGINELRTERDKLLSETDWIMVEDYPGTDKAAWIDYRQKLRDLPSGYVPISNPVYPKIPK
jgi:hypothetical protein